MSCTPTTIQDQVGVLSTRVVVLELQLAGLDELSRQFQQHVETLKVTNEQLFRLVADLRANDVIDGM
jgi:cell division protein FtsB